MSKRRRRALTAAEAERVEALIVSKVDRIRETWEAVGRPLPIDTAVIIVLDIHMGMMPGPTRDEAWRRFQVENR